MRDKGAGAGDGGTGRGARATVLSGGRGAPRRLRTSFRSPRSRDLLLRRADTDPGDTIPLASVGNEALQKTVEYMEKMAEFKADGTSDEDKLAWVGEYKKAMEPQDQLPLLFQTMTVRTICGSRRPFGAGRARLTLAAVFPRRRRTS